MSQNAGSTADLANQGTCRRAPSASLLPLARRVSTHSYGWSDSAMRSQGAELHEGKQSGIDPLENLNRDLHRDDGLAGARRTLQEIHTPTAVSTYSISI